MIYTINRVNICINVVAFFSDTIEISVRKLKETAGKYLSLGILSPMKQILNILMNCRIYT